MDLKHGDKFQIPNDGFGNPVLQFCRVTKTYGKDLQWFEVVKIDEHGNMKVIPIWNNA